MNIVRGLSLVLVLLAIPAQAAPPPPYLVLTTPRVPSQHQPTYGYYPGYAQPVQSSMYSYGWFGVKPRRHWSKHHGFYRSYTEWSAR